MLIYIANYQQFYKLGRANIGELPHRAIFCTVGANLTTIQNIFNVTFKRHADCYTGNLRAMIDIILANAIDNCDSPQLGKIIQYLPATIKTLPNTTVLFHPREVEIITQVQIKFPYLTTGILPENKPNKAFDRIIATLNDTPRLINGILTNGTLIGFFPLCLEIILVEECIVQLPIVLKLPFVFDLTINNITYSKVPPKCTKKWAKHYAPMYFIYNETQFGLLNSMQRLISNFTDEPLNIKLDAFTMVQICHLCQLGTPAHVVFVRRLMKRFYFESYSRFIKLT